MAHDGHSSHRPRCASNTLHTALILQVCLLCYAFNLFLDTQLNSSEHCSQTFVKIYKSWPISYNQLHWCALVFDALSPLAHTLRRPHVFSPMFNGMRADMMTVHVAIFYAFMQVNSAVPQQPASFAGHAPHTLHALDTILLGQCIGYIIAWSMHWYYVAWSMHWELCRRNASRGHVCAGYGFYRPHVQMMDPGWLAGRTQRGPEDQGTQDGGNDPVGVVKRCN